MDLKDFEAWTTDVEVGRHDVPFTPTDPFVITTVTIHRTERRMNPDFDQDARCDCGHTYHRHFDYYENCAPVGCKYCQCGTWHEPVQKAGIIPYYIDKERNMWMMFMVSSDPKYGGPLPQISKGYVDPEDEGSLSGAIREGQEELGLKLENVTHERFGVYEVYKGSIKGDEKEYSFKLYACEIKDRSDFDKPHFETKEVVWMTPAQFQFYGREAHRDLVKQAFAKIGEHHGYANDQ